MNNTQDENKTINSSLKTGIQGSREVWDQVNQVLPGTISRASIINFLNASVENGLLEFKETTGKGGYRRLYTPKRSKDETSKYLSKIVQDQLQTL